MLSVVVPQRVGAGDSIDTAYHTVSIENARTALNTDVGGRDAFGRYAMTLGAQMAEDHALAEIGEDL